MTVGLLNAEPPFTLCGTGLPFLKTTVSPTRALSVLGLNESVPIVTVCVCEPGDDGALPPPPPPPPAPRPPGPPGVRGAWLSPPGVLSGGGTVPEALTTLTVPLMPSCRMQS